MSKTLRVLSLVVLCAGFAAIATASSHQDAPIYVWISEVKAKPGQGDALVELLKKDAEVYDPLIESGAAVEWGIAMPVVHSGGDSGVRYQWISFVGWAGADQFMAGFMARMQAASEEQREAMAEEWQATVEPGSHADTINRSIHAGKAEAVPARYIHLSYRTAKPGKGREAVEFYKKNIAPVYDQLAADGAILNYGLHVPEIRQGRPWTHMAWRSSENLAARDAITAAFGAWLSSPENAELYTGVMMDLFEPTPVDQILMVVHHKTASSDGD